MIWRTSQPVLLQSAEAECSRLREENAHLRRLLAEHNILIPPAEPPMRPFVKPMEVSPLDEREERARKRIVLFRNLFRGREDVYACRWESPDGRSGYSPAAQKDWKAINRSRPEDRKKVESTELIRSALGFCSRSSQCANRPQASVHHLPDACGAPRLAAASPRSDQVHSSRNGCGVFYCQKR
jgi:hypothetical protein